MPPTLSSSTGFNLSFSKIFSDTFDLDTFDLDDSDFLDDLTVVFPELTKSIESVQEEFNQLNDNDCVQEVMNCIESKKEMLENEKDDFFSSFEKDTEPLDDTLNPLGEFSLFAINSALSKFEFQL